MNLKATLDASLFFTDLQQRLQAAKTVGDLHTVASGLDSDDFNALPAEAREDLGALYAHRLLIIGGWGAP